MLQLQFITDVISAGEGATSVSFRRVRQTTIVEKVSFKFI